MDITATQVKILQHLLHSDLAIFRFSLSPQASPVQRRVNYDAPPYRWQIRYQEGGEELAEEEKESESVAHSLCWPFLSQFAFVFEDERAQLSYADVPRQMSFAAARFWWISKATLGIGKRFSWEKGNWANCTQVHVYKTSCIASPHCPFHLLDFPSLLFSSLSLLIRYSQTILRCIEP